uniref:Uncharacterized protein n=1 Tax=Rhipicephalus appendiculatus TaxID=34631 RepID=A0A131YBT4_RHIAP
MLHMSGTVYLHQSVFVPNFRPECLPTFPASTKNLIGPVINSFFLRMAGANFHFKMTLMLKCAVYLLSRIAPTKVFKNIVVIVQFFSVRECREGRHFLAIPLLAFSVWPLVGVTVRLRREHNITHRCTMRFVYRADDFQRPWLEL